MVARLVQELVPTLRLLHMEDICTVHHWGMHWVLVAKSFAADVVGMDIDTQVPVPSSGIASMNYQGVVGKMVVVEEETADAVALVLYAVGEELIDSRSMQREVRMVGWVERWTQFAKEGHYIHYIAGMMSGVWWFAGIEFEKGLVEALAG